MKIVTPLPDSLKNRLTQEGFKHKGAIYLRLFGDGVLQSVFSPYHPSILDKDRPIAISIRSIYEPDVFDDVKILRGALTYPYELRAFCTDFTEDIPAETLFVQSCLPVLNHTKSQIDFCNTINRLELNLNRKRGPVWYMEMLTIPALVFCQKYDLALEKCNEALANNPSISWVKQMKDLLQQGDITTINLFFGRRKAKELRNIFLLKL